MLIFNIYICINAYTNEVFPCKIMYNACICISFTSYITFKKMCVYIYISSYHIYKYIYMYIIISYIYIHTYYCGFSYFTIVFFDKTLVNVGRRGPK